MQNLSSPAEKCDPVVRTTWCPACYSSALAESQLLIAARIRESILQNPSASLPRDDSARADAFEGGNNNPDLLSLDSALLIAAVSMLPNWIHQGIQSARDYSYKSQRHQNTHRSSAHPLASRY